jgi:hypothetical protein
MSAPPLTPWCDAHAAQGVLELFGKPIDLAAKDDTLAQLRLSKIGFVFQTFNLLGTLSAFENVELPMSIEGCVSPSRCLSPSLPPLPPASLSPFVPSLHRYLPKWRVGVCVFPRHTLHDVDHSLRCCHRDVRIPTGSYRARSARSSLVGCWASWACRTE